MSCKLVRMQVILDSTTKHSQMDTLRLATISLLVWLDSLGSLRAYNLSNLVPAVACRNSPAALDVRITYHVCFDSLFGLRASRSTAT
jgi:hypothetical protein